MLHDAYARDTYVIDVDSFDDAPSMPRVPTEELTMHVNVLGRWHRRTPDLAATACGILYHSQFCPPRREELVGDLCGECFTEFERNRADENNAKDTSRKDQP